MTQRISKEALVKELQLSVPAVYDLSLFLSYLPLEDSNCRYLNLRMMQNDVVIEGSNKNRAIKITIN